MGHYFGRNSSSPVPMMTCTGAKKWSKESIFGVVSLAPCVSLCRRIRTKWAMQVVSHFVLRQNVFDLPRRVFITWNFGDLTTKNAQSCEWSIWSSFELCRNSKCPNGKRFETTIKKGSANIELSECLVFQRFQRDFLQFMKNFCNQTFGVSECTHTNSQLQVWIVCFQCARTINNVKHHNTTSANGTNVNNDGKRSKNMSQALKTRPQLHCLAKDWQCQSWGGRNLKTSLTFANRVSLHIFSMDLKFQHNAPKVALPPAMPQAALHCLNFVFTILFCPKQHLEMSHDEHVIFLGCVLSCHQWYKHTSKNNENADPKLQAFVWFWNNFFNRRPLA